MAISIQELDSLKIRVAVSDDSGEPVNLTSASFQCAAGGGAYGVSGTVTPIDLAEGVVDVSFSSNTIDVGRWATHLRVTIDGETQTVYREILEVTPSIVAS